MTLKDTMKELESLGTEQNRKTYMRHGVKPPLFGVSFAHIYKLQKKIKRDHALALGLWASGNHDARVLATLIADPDQFDEKTADAWMKDCDNKAIVGQLDGLVFRTKFARKKSEQWIKSIDEETGAAGWDLMARLAAVEDNGLPDSYFEQQLGVIEKSIRSAKNRVRYAMNFAVIGIGIRNANLQKKAIAAAQRIGKVEVDHGDTGCKTPDAVAYIRKAVAHKAAKAKMGK